MPLGKPLAVNERGTHADAINLAMAQKIGLVLEQHYPGHFFYVEVDARTGVAKINIPNVMGSYYYIVHLSTLKSDPGMRSIIKAGGEILERYNMPRSRVDRSLVREVFAAHRLRPSNRIVPDELR